MRGALVATVLLAACGGSGVDLEVRTDQHFDHVEVFVGTDDCYTPDPSTQQMTACPGVAWQAGQVRPDGDVFVMTPDENIISTDQVDGSTATIHVEATDTYRQPKVIAVVAFAGETAVAYGTLWGVRIPANSAEHWLIALDKAAVASDDVTSPPDSGPDKRVFAWARQRIDKPETYSKCLAMQEWDDGDKLWKSTFIVPETDHDCDGQEIECDPLYANYNEAGAESKCVTEVGTIQLHPCAVGISECADGISPTAACTLPADGLTCVPAAACTACEGAGDTLSCLVNAFVTLPPDPGLTAFRCTFHATDSGGDCALEQTANSAQITLPVSCSGAVVHDATMPFSNSGSSSQIAIGNPGMAKVDVTVNPSATSTCTITLYWSTGSVDPAAPTRRTVILEVTSSTTPNTIRFPVHLDWGNMLTNACDSPSSPTHSACTSDNAGALQDTMYQCLR